MAQAVNEELVNTVFQRVMAELAKADGAGSAADPQPAPAPAPPGAPGRVWLTVEMLAARADGAGAVALAHNERLTPAARDYAASRGLEVVRGAAPAQRPVTHLASGQVTPAALTRTLALVVNRPDSKVEAALAALTRAGVVTRGFAEADCWMANTRAMCAEIGSGALAGGVLIDRYAAAGIVLAAKIKGIRPVQGVSAAAVEAALRQFNANLLVIGHATHSVYEIRSMIDRFSAGRRMGRDRTILLDEVERVEAET